MLVHKKIYSSSNFAWLLIPFVLAGVIAISFGIAQPRNVRLESVHKIVKFMCDIVPTIHGISTYTSNPSWSELLISIQWVFAPIYLITWFTVFSPFSGKLKNKINDISIKMSRGQRIAVIIGLVVLTAYFLSDMGILDIPTLFNGKLAYPPATATPLLRPIYRSWLFLSLYAWISTFVECGMLRAFAVLAVNLKTYMFPSGDA